MLVIRSPLLKRRCSIRPPTSNITGTLGSLPIREGSGSSNPQRRHCCLPSLRSGPAWCTTPLSCGGSSDRGGAAGGGGGMTPRVAEVAASGTSLTGAWCPDGAGRSTSSSYSVTTRTLGSSSVSARLPRSTGQALRSAAGGCYGVHKQRMTPARPAQVEATVKCVQHHRRKCSVGSSKRASRARGR